MTSARSAFDSASGTRAVKKRRLLARFVKIALGIATMGGLLVALGIAALIALA